MCLHSNSQETFLWSSVYVVLLDGWMGCAFFYGLDNAMSLYLMDMESQRMLCIKGSLL